MNGKMTCVLAMAMTTTGLAVAQEITDQEATSLAPMTRSERFHEYLRGMFGRKALAMSATHAELGQLTNTPKEWGGGAEGFAKRLGSGYGHHFVRKTLEYGMSSILHEDNRYRRSGKHGFFKRTGYAVTSTFLTRRDNGRRGFGFSKVGSAGGASFLSRLWMPHALATAGAGASSFGITLGVDAGSNVVREFWPEIKHKFRRER